ncbi:hypothetical protein PLANPX_3930 [Lacipirellula parvula]|uniref:Uncharacterized protein n=1 Tax=Lacipirellula parvula TaxID=2650471 RepID=A0A5K7XCX8_9BACT|nr:hypothetical protein PLANPX_3930 [Lacipirellula parvula]
MLFSMRRKTPISTAGNDEALVHVRFTRAVTHTNGRNRI